MTLDGVRIRGGLSPRRTCMVVVDAANGGRDSCACLCAPMQMKGGGGLHHSFSGCLHTHGDFADYNEV